MDFVYLLINTLNCNKEQSLTIWKLKVLQFSFKIKIVTLAANNYCIYKVNLSNKNLVLTFKNGNKANYTDYVDMYFITVNILKSILPWTVPNISILSYLICTYKCLI